MVLERFWVGASGGEGCEVGARFLIRKCCLEVKLSRESCQSSERPPLEELDGLGNKCDQMCVVLGLNFFSFPG
jgi:hypothetical protein